MKEHIRSVPLRRLAVIAYALFIAPFHMIFSARDHCHLLAGGVRVATYSLRVYLAAFARELRADFRIVVGVLAESWRR